MVQKQYIVEFNVNEGKFGIFIEKWEAILNGSSEECQMSWVEDITLFIFGVAFEVVGQGTLEERKKICEQGNNKISLIYTTSNLFLMWELVSNWRGLKAIVEDPLFILIFWFMFCFLEMGCDGCIDLLIDMI